MNDKPRKVCPGCKKAWIDDNKNLCAECDATERKRWVK